MLITQYLKENAAKGIAELYQETVESEGVNITVTRKEFEGDYTIVVFPFTRMAKKKPEQIGQDLGEFLKANVEEVIDFNVIKGFLNLVVSDSYWKSFLLNLKNDNTFGQQPANGKKVLVEFSSPNTNKPLHLGHIRNILLGWSCSKILKAAGYEVINTQIVNDRGIAICRSMLAWQKFGEGQTPESTGIKGDHFVGQYYVRFATEFKKEYAAWQTSEKGQAVLAEQKSEKQTEEAFFKKYKDKYFNEYSELGKEAKALLIKWEANDPEVRALWAKMNGWVYDGFEKTYETLGVDFDKLYYESDTYLLGKDMIDKGLETKVFQQENKRIFADLEEVKLGVKTVIKSDGTSTYTSQDIGTAAIRYQDYKMDSCVYVVADEQDNHFQVLFEILKRLEEPYAANLYHLSYGMVDLPTGKMKSREGTVVDADDLMQEVQKEASASATESGSIVDLPQDEQDEIVRKIGLSALKYFILKVNPRKRMVFDPKESVDMQGNTGPYIQNAYVRSQSVLRKAADADTSLATNYTDLAKLERGIIAMIYEYPALVKTAAENYDPSMIASFCYDLAKTFHKFYHDHPILKAESEEAKAFRLEICKAVGNSLNHGMNLLGIEMPERM